MSAAQQMVFTSACPHCTKEQQVLVLIDEARGEAVLMAGRDQEHLAAILREALDGVEELDESGIRRGGRRG